MIMKDVILSTRRQLWTDKHPRFSTARKSTSYLRSMGTRGQGEEEEEEGEKTVESADAWEEWRLLSSSAVG